MKILCLILALIIKKEAVSDPNFRQPPENQTNLVKNP